jgi:hypothetical protein
MNVTLTYRGALVGSDDRRTRVAAKHSLRLVFHEQLEDLWQTDGRFSAIDASTLQEPTLTEGPKGHPVLDVSRPINTQAGWFYRYKVRDRFFIPLINEPRQAQCHLAIQLHSRMKGGGGIFAGGDLDNRMKTLFDSLRMPHNENELPDPLGGPEHIYCLLDDDQRITKVSVESIPLWGPKRSDEDDNYVELECNVTVQAIRPMVGNYDFLFP